MTTRLLRAASAVGVVGIATVAGCKFGPNYERPAVTAPESYRDQPASSAADGASFADLNWWQVYKDPQLQSLVRTALEHNYDAQIAVTRILQAEAIEIQTASPLYPQIGYQGGIATGRNSFLGTPNPNNGTTTGSALLTLSCAWEIDLWGRVQRADEAALAQILAAEENRRAVMLTLVTSVAQAYFELLELDLEVEIARQNVASFQQSLDLFSRRANGGVDSQLQVLRAQANLSQVAATIPELQRLTAIKENQINLLLGTTPGPITRGKPLVEQEMPVEIPVGLPSSLLERRPDIRASEQQLVAANAQIGAAIANFFPQIGLTTFFGKASPSLSSFTSGSTNAWGVGANLSGPIFTAGLTQAQVDQAKAQFQEAKLRYEQIVNASFHEVADTLVTREKLISIEQELQVQVKSLSGAVVISRDRYAVGRASYFEILDAQQQLYPAQTSLARAKADQYIAVIQLYKALGGGWNLPTDDWTDPQH